MKAAKNRKAKSGALTPVSRVWPPFRPLRRLLQADIDRMFEGPFGGWLTPARDFLELWEPAVDVYEDKYNVVVKVEIPGMRKEEIDVYMTGMMLNIAGELKEETERKGAQSHRSERLFGRFRRGIPLTAAVEAGKIKAAYKDGVLTITCPKTEEAKRKETQIKVE